MDLRFNQDNEPEFVYAKDLFFLRAVEHRYDF